jgi:hypothetical protein
VTTHTGLRPRILKQSSRAALLGMSALCVAGALSASAFAQTVPGQGAPAAPPTASTSNAVVNAHPAEAAPSAAKGWWDTVT